MGKKSASLEKILATRTRKGPPPYVGMEPQMVNPAPETVYMASGVTREWDVIPIQG